MSTETYVNVARDSAGATTDPVTVPLVLAMGVGFGNATHAVDGFGILFLAPVGPIIAVLVFRLWSRYKSTRKVLAATRAKNLAIIEETGGTL